MSDNHLTPEKIKKFRARPDRLNLLFQWVKDDRINYQQFLILLEKNKEETELQISYDSYD